MDIDATQAQAATPPLPTPAELAAAAEAELFGAMTGDAEEPTPEPAKAPEAAKPADPVVAEPTQTQIDEPVAETAVEEPAGGETPQADPAAPVSERIRLAGTEADKALANAANLLVRTLGISLVDAMDRITGRQPTTQAQAEPVAIEPVRRGPDIAAMQAEVEAIEAQLDEAGAAEGLFTPEVAKLTKALTKASTNLAIAQSQVQSQQQQAELTDAQMRKAWTAELQSVTTTYPDMADKSSAQYMIARQLTQDAKADPRHPLHAAVFAADAPSQFARAAADKLKIAPVTAKPVTPVSVSTPQQVAAKQPPVTPASGSKSTQATTAGTAAQPTAADLIAEMQADLESVQTGGTSTFARPSVWIR